MSDAINPQHYKRLPVEAIDIIEAAIDRAPSNRDALLHGQALKYLLRCWNKNGIEDLKKAKWYLDRLIGSFNASEAEQLATGEVAGEGTGEVKPPDGWRWLELGEVIRKGDRYFDGAEWKDRTRAISEKYSPGHSKTIRRNKFKTGERVFLSKSDDPNFFRVAKHISDELVLVYCDGTPFQFFVDQLAPYIEDAA